MREPLLRGTSDRTGSTFSFICIPNLILTANLGVVGLLDSNMKAVGILSALLLATCAAPAFAQISKEQIKERKLIKSSTQSELKQKASKVARKEAKKLYKEGWTITPGALPIEKQLDKSYMMSYEYDDNMFPKFIMGEAMSIGENYDAAKMQALELEYCCQPTTIPRGSSIRNTKYTCKQEPYTTEYRKNNSRNGSLPYSFKQEQGSPCPYCL